MLWIPGRVYIRRWEEGEGEDGEGGLSAPQF